MIKFLKELFTSKQTFKIVNFDESLNVDIEGFIAISEKSSRIEFYIVLETNTLLPFIEEEDAIIRLSTWLKQQKFYTDSFNKNTTLIILNEGDYIIEEKIKRQILEIEENPYYFKKYILRYSESQCNDLNKAIIDVSEEELNNLITKLDFDNFKANPLSEGYVPLLLNLFIKIPFLKVPFHEKELEDLQTIIHNKIEKSKFDDLKTIHQICLKQEDSDIFKLFGIPIKFENEI